jgi:hypothetical protein
MLTFNQVRQTMNNIHEDVVTLYLHVDPSHRPNQNQPPAWNIFVKNALRDIETNLNGADSDNWNATRQQLDNFLEGYRPKGKTLVVFAGANTFETYDLGVSYPMQWQRLLR